MSDWNSFFISVRKYLEYFRSCDQIPSMRGFPTVSVSQVISEHELAGLLSWAELTAAVVRVDPEARRQMFEDRQWNCVENVIGLLSCSIPLILKGKLYGFLAALAIDEGAAVNIWNCMISEGICVEMVDGKLSGIQQDLEEQECVTKVYDCSQGFLVLMKELFRHKTRPGAAQLSPYLLFIVKSIVCQFMSRSYSDTLQMWELVKLGLDCLFELLRMFYVTQAAVSNRTSEVQLLTQLLNDTPLLRNVLNVIVEGSHETKELYPRNTCRDEASLSAIRLIYMAVCHRSSLADAIRAVASNIMICSLEALMFSAIPAKPTHNCLALLFSYVSENDYFVKHSFYVIRILRDLCCQRPSLQKQIVQSAIVGQASLMEIMARLTSIFSYEVEVSHLDLVISDVESHPISRIRGEIIRNLLETFIDAIESDPRSTNIAYVLLGFDMKDITNTDINIANRNADVITCLHNFLEIANILTNSDDPFSVSFCALYEPSLRLLLKLSTFTSISSSVILRIMRSHYDLVYKLANSRVFRKVDSFSSRKLCLTNDAECSSMILRKSIQCIVLELIALEFSALLRFGHIEQPKKIIIALLAVQADVCDYNGGGLSPDESSFATTTLTTEETPDRVLLWSLLEQSKVDVEELKIPSCCKFDLHKVDELLRFCVHKNACNIEQFDIEYLHLLLNTEINSIMNSEIGLIREEARDILEFCAEHNAKNLLEGACIHLLSGWLSVVNVLALHSPLNFIDADTNKKFLVDALFLLKNYCFCVDTSVEITAMISNCIFRVTRAICNFFQAGHPNGGVRQTLFPIIHLLLQCLALPRYSKCIRFKLDIYGSILCVFDTCNRIQQRENLPSSEQQNDSKSALSRTSALDTSTKGTTRLAELMEEERNDSEYWSKFFEPMAAEIVDTISSDITYAPLMIKIAATACLSDIIREDIVHSRSVAYHFVYSGAMTCVLDTLSRVVTESKNNKASKGKQSVLVKALFSLLSRLAASEHGWKDLINATIFRLK